MRKEEALFKAKNVLDEATAYEDAVCYVTGDDREWLEMAIEALELTQTGLLKDCESCRAELPSTDAISRQAVHIELEKWITYGEYKYSNATKYLYDRIDRLPPVTPQQDTVPFDFELYQAGLMDMPKEMVKVLDKIRAEIDSLTYYWCEVNPRSVIDDVLKIIDKYRAESEKI